jgi:hypothetical protein
LPLTVFLWTSYAAVLGQSPPMSALTDRCQAIHPDLGSLEKGVSRVVPLIVAANIAIVAPRNQGPSEEETRHVNLARTNFLLDRLLCLTPRTTGKPAGRSRRGRHLLRQN